MPTVGVLQRRPHSNVRTQHTPCYCEENVYLLCQALVKQDAEEELYVIFISNAEKKVFTEASYLWKALKHHLAHI